MVEINRVWLNVDTDTNKITLFSRPRVSIRVDEYIWNLIEEHIVKPHMLIDTVGMSTLFLPDLQYHFHDMDPNWVVNHAYNVASYILANDNPIQDGETVDGVENGQMSREFQWKCQYEDALIQPPRGVLDINMGDYASGKR